MATTNNPQPTLIPFKSLGDYDYINAIFFGPFGAGKTVLAATAQSCPYTGNALYASAEGGHSSIRDFGIKVDIFRINTFKAFNRLYEFARNHANLRDLYWSLDDKDPKKAEVKSNLLKLKAWLMEKTEEEILKLNPAEPVLYQTVIVDSLTEVQKYAMYHILNIDINTVSLAQEMPIPQLQHWGKNSEMIRMLVRAFRDLKMHTFFTALDSIEKDERDGSIMILPSLPGKLGKEVCGFLDIVGYLHVRENPDNKEPQRVLQVQPAGKWNAKSRYRALGTYIVDPTVGKMVELITKK